MAPPRQPPRHARRIARSSIRTDASATDPPRGRAEVERRSSGDRVDEWPSCRRANVSIELRSRFRPACRRASVSIELRSRFRPACRRASVSVPWILQWVSSRDPGHRDVIVILQWILQWVSSWGTVTSEEPARCPRRRRPGRVAILGFVSASSRLRAWSHEIAEFSAQ